MEHRRSASFESKGQMLLLINLTWSRLAKNFTKPNFFEPLTRNEDTLPGRHANTHLAQVA